MADSCSKTFPVAFENEVRLSHSTLLYHPFLSTPVLPLDRHQIQQWLHNDFTVIPDKGKTKEIRCRQKTKQARSRPDESGGSAEKT